MRKIEDPFFRFWYRFVPKYSSAIHSGRADQIYDLAIKPDFPDYMGLIFERMCRDFLIRYAKNLPIFPGEIGQWWGSDPKTRRQVQIDLVAASAVGDEYLIGSCKYRKEPVGLSFQKSGLQKVSGRQKDKGRYSCTH